MGETRDKFLLPFLSFLLFFIRDCSAAPLSSSATLPR